MTARKPTPYRKKSLKKKEMRQGIQFHDSISEIVRIPCSEMRGRVTGQQMEMVTPLSSQEIVERSLLLVKIVGEMTEF